jgi:hypothetical protein
MSTQYNPPVQVVGYVATRTGDEERGPVVWLNGSEAQLRLLTHGELVYVQGPRRRELAEFRVDDTLPRGGAVLRDVAGITLTEIIRIIKLDLDRAEPRGHYA